MKLRGSGRRFDYGLLPTEMRQSCRSSSLKNSYPSGQPVRAVLGTGLDHDGSTQLRAPEPGLGSHSNRPKRLGTQTRSHLLERLCIISCRTNLRSHLFSIGCISTGGTASLGSLKQTDFHPLNYVGNPVAAGVSGWRESTGLPPILEDVDMTNDLVKEAIKKLQTSRKAFAPWNQLLQSMERHCKDHKPKNDLKFKKTDGDEFTLRCGKETERVTLAADSFDIEYAITTSSVFANTARQHVSGDNYRGTFRARVAGDTVEYYRGDKKMSIPEIGKTLIELLADAAARTGRRLSK